MNAPAISPISTGDSVQAIESHIASSAVGSKNRLLRGVIETTFITSIFLAVAGFGGSEPLSWSISQDLIFLTAIALVLTRRKSGPVRNKPALFVLVVLVIWVVFQWFGSLYGRIGLDPYGIRFRGLAFAAAIAGFFIALEISCDRAARHRLGLSLIALAVFESIYGLAQNPGGWQYIWNYRRIYYTGSATGTYINHNHFAGLLEMILPLTLALAFYYSSKTAERSQTRSRSVGSVFQHMGQPAILKSLLLLLGSIVIFVAIAFSLSRMGLACALFSILVFAALTFAARRFSRVNWKLLVGCLVLSAGIATWIGAGPIVEHFALLSSNVAQSDRSEGRLALWHDAAKLIRTHPITGVGLGCFEFAFTRFQSTELTLTIDHAHNDYLELAAELGTPAAAILFTLIGFILARATRAALRASSHRDRAIAVGAIAGTTALLVHGAVDFNFYIPANALVFTTLLAVSCSLCDQRQPRTGV